MTDEQIEAAAVIQAIAEEMNATEKRWPVGKARRQGRRLLAALDALTEDVRPQDAVSDLASSEAD